MAGIFGCAGPVLSPDERQFFSQANPLGFILFARNVEGPAQLRALIGSLRACVTRDDVLILIDQEGGRVARLPSPPWASAPPARVFGNLYAVDPDRGLDACRLNAKRIATELAELGINVNCAPVVDVWRPETHEIIGDRAFGPDSAAVASLGRAACEGFMAAGVLPVIKHIPGHGRARLDSHKALPIVRTEKDELDASDFMPFRMLSDMPIAMTAHVVYAAIDDTWPATVSRKVLQEIVRSEMKFDGLLLSDDLSMHALHGTIGERTRAALTAGCDAVLHCNGDLSEMNEVAENCGTLAASGQVRLARAFAGIGPTDPIAEAEQERLASLLAEAGSS